MMLRILQCCSVARVLSPSKTTIIHQATRGQRSLTVSCLQQQGLLLSHQLRKKYKPQILETQANNAVRFFSLTPPKDIDFTVTSPIPSWSQITAAAEWLTKVPTIALSPEPCHPTLDRPHEMKKVEEALEKQSKSVKVVYLVGEPGVGKSQLARKYGVGYAAKYSTSTKTVLSTKIILTLDMKNFRANYSKLAVKLGLSRNIADGQSLDIVAEEMKKILSKNNHWLLIIDNYDSTEYEGFNRDLLPLQGSTGEWGSGTVLVTTNNAEVIPNFHASKVTVEPLSTEESSKLVELAAGYTLSSKEKTCLEGAVQKRHWRLIPLVMASVGNYIGLRRNQDADTGYVYNLNHYVKELEDGEAMDPEHLNRENIELALQNMTKTSDTLKKTFTLLAMCPDNVRIPRLLFEKLMKKYYQAEWAHKYDEIANCTVLTVERNVLKEVKVHKQYHQAMQNITKFSSSSTAYTAEEEELISMFIDCITETFSHIFTSVIANNRTSLMLDSLRLLLTQLEKSIEGSERFSKEVKMRIQCARRD